jgi:hypothetical protein
MSETIDTVQSNEYLLGKASGLIGKFAPISEYKKKLDEMNSINISKIEANIATIEKKVTSLIEILEKLRQTSENKQKSILDSQGRILNDLSKISINIGNANTSITAAAEEVIKISMETFRRNASSTAFSYDEEVKILHEMEKGLSQSLDFVKSSAVDLIDKLRQNNVDIKEFERGYLCGITIKNMKEGS